MRRLGFRLGGCLLCSMFRLLKNLGSGHLRLLGRLGNRFSRCGMYGCCLGFLMCPGLRISLVNSVGLLFPDRAGLGSCRSCCGLDGIHSGSRCRGRPHRIAGYLTADSAGKTAF